MNSIQTRHMVLFHAARHTEIALKADLKPTDADRQEMKKHEAEFNHFLGIIRKNGSFVSESFSLPYRYLAE
ncbi:MAG TPA: hypothetical protein EYP35_06425 [Desulfobacterales bacterium]|nr:hypothetical protein [Desulfobacterales bacterium]HIP39448.1 hypothetical protein [Desulfocapsa sulfexigens]